jgi:hypothetical protein
MNNIIKISILNIFLSASSILAFPYGVPVSGKAGFVTSPYAQFEGYVDVRGFPKGTEVKCPYSGKIFLVPSIEENVTSQNESGEIITARREGSHEPTESCDDEAMADLESQNASENENARNQRLINKAYQDAFAEARANGDSLIDCKKYALQIAREKEKELLWKKWSEWTEAGKRDMEESWKRNQSPQRTLGNFPSFDQNSSQ